MNKKTLISWNSIEHPDIDQKIEQLRENGRGAISQYVRLALRAYIQLEEEGAVDKYSSTFKRTIIKGSAPKKQTNASAETTKSNSDSNEEYVDAFNLFQQGGLL
ncbi:hypothetical protein [Shouchella clausii]|uniref:hypothetical protein n=1 Tax=Shouchella clausii TaxID=79880 RepID=UPI001C7358CF|nr:hypothetical protein [Shouchella clausii]MBX0320329.1 hypothetical protein [Shouchella clausii]MEB5480907.1 hypothetical protein [Shouchella clausii]